MASPALDISGLLHQHFDSILVESCNIEPGSGDDYASLSLIIPAALLREYYRIVGGEGSFVGAGLPDPQDFYERTDLAQRLRDYTRRVNGNAPLDEVLDRLEYGTCRYALLQDPAWVRLTVDDED